MGIEHAEELGYDAVWAPDHLILGRDNAKYEVWTLLSPITGFTDDIDISSLVLSNDYRNPAPVPKMAATLDIISDGRLQLGMGAGWHVCQDLVEVEHSAQDARQKRYSVTSTNGNETPHRG